MADFTITLNGTSFGGINEYSPTLQPIVKNAERNLLNGDAYAEFIANKVTISLAFRNRSESQCSAIRNAVTSSYFFPVTYRDIDGSNVTKTFYKSPIKYNPVKYSVATGEFNYDMIFEIIEK